MFGTKRREIVTTRVKKKNRKTMLIRVVSVFLALLMVGSSILAIIELL